MVLIADIGNSAIKIGRFAENVDADNPLETPQDTIVVRPEDDSLALSKWLDPNDRILVACSVSQRNADHLVTILQQIQPIRVRFLLTQDFWIEKRVKYPERVGLDRLAGAVAANWIRDPFRTAIVIDAGSAITVDLVSVDGVFEGGTIMAGAGLLTRALSSGTAQLPLIEYHETDAAPSVVGRSTEEAIQSGVYWGTIGAIRQVVQQMQSELSSPAQIFVTGGDMQKMMWHLPDHAEFVPHLILSGIELIARRLDLPL
ncbi:MAG: type III pantothenate kinase [Planctomycetales bacterium]|nr:type III pantothenate kinase [Planctomycetales bacterium]